MASTSITNSSANPTGVPFGNICSLVKASNRLYALIQDGSNLKYFYSDDSGTTWSAGTTVKASASRWGVMVYNQADARLEFFSAGSNGGSEDLTHRAITSNVTTGTPGALNTEAVIEAGGASAGVEFVSACISNSVTNPRLWIVGSKWTSGTNRETKIWWVATGTSPDTAGNYSSTSNLGGDNGANSAHMGIPLYQKIGGNDRLFVIFGDPTTSPTRLECILFDPTVASGSVAGAITGATVNNFGALASGGFDQWENEGPQLWATSFDDAIVVGRRDPSSGKVDWYYSTNGTSFTAVTSGSITAGRSGITTDGTDFHIIHSDTYGVAATTDQTMSYRKLTWSSKTLGGATVFSDGNGNGVQLPRNTGTTSVFAVFRRGTASPFSVRSDIVSIASDTTPPGQATGFTATAISSGTEIDLAATMPTDPDVASYEIRYLSGTTYPASNRSDGTTAPAETATTAGATITSNVTGLTGGTVYSFRLFVKDASGNWNTGTQVQATAATRPVFLQRYKADGVTTVPDGTTQAGPAPVLEYQCDPSAFNPASVAHFRLRAGTDNATPPTTLATDLFSGDGGSIFRYETTVGSGIWANVPASGLPSAVHQRVGGIKLRIYTPGSFVGPRVCGARQRPARARAGLALVGRKLESRADRGRAHLG